MPAKKASVIGQPQNCIEYVVQKSDTLERIAACHDCTPTELMKLNRLSSRTVFPGQKIFIPDPAALPATGMSQSCSNDNFTSSGSFDSNSHPPSAFSEKLGNNNAADIDSSSRTKGVMHFDRKSSDENSRHFISTTTTHAEVHQKPKLSTNLSLNINFNKQAETVALQPLLDAKKSDSTTKSPEEDLDVECLQRFLKLNVKHFTDNEGVVNGVLLVTPNCIMFDPDLNHPLVKENGAERYGMIAKMEDIVSAGLYKDIAAMTSAEGECLGDNSNQVTNNRESLYNENDLARSRSNSNRFHSLQQQEPVRLSIDSDSEQSNSRKASAGDDSIFSDNLADLEMGAAKRSSSPLELGTHFVPGNLPDIPELGSPLRVFDAPAERKPSESQDSDQPASGSCPENYAIEESNIDNSSMQVNIDENSQHVNSETSLNVCPPEIARQTSCPAENVNEELLAECIAAAKSADSVPTALVDDGKLSVDYSSGGSNASEKKGGFLRGRMRTFHDTVSSQKSVPLISSRPFSARRKKTSADAAAKEAAKPRSASHSESTASASSTENLSSNNRQPSDSNRLSGLTRQLSKKAISIGGAVGSGVQQVGGAFSSGAQAVGGALTTGVTHVGGALSTGAQAVGGALSTGVNQVGGAITTGAQAAAGALTTGVNQVGGAISTGAQAVGGAALAMGDVLQTGAQSVGGALQTGAQQLVSVPRNIANMSAGLFVPDETCSAASANSYLDWNEGQFGTPPREIKRQRSYMKLEELKHRSEQVRATAVQSLKPSFVCATSREEKPNLFAPIEDMLSPLQSPTTELPYFLCIRLNSKKLKERRKRAHSELNPDDEPLLVFGEMKKTEYWYTCPKDKADNLYVFLLQWSPEKYGEAAAVPATAVTAGDTGEEPDSPVKSPTTAADHEGFVVIEADEEDDHLKNDTFVSAPSSCFGGNSTLMASLNREWEIVTIEEVKRRLSLLDEFDISKFPLPEGAASSKILSETQIRDIISILPARAEGYPWVLVYSTAEHGFSLKTLYRKMQLWNEEMSPSLLIVEDTNKNIFGAILSGPIKMADHFWGTGESRLFTFYPEFTEFTWTGDNNYFCKGSIQSLAVGGGKGKFGIWLDGDFYKGRTQECETFANKPLTATEDFTIAHVEAFGFSMV